MNKEKLAFKFLKIDECYIITGNIEDLTDAAGYVLEIKDFFGNEKEVLFQKRTLNEQTSAIIGYRSATIAEEITETEYYKSFVAYLQKVGKEQRVNEAFNYYFKMTEERRAFLVYFLHNKIEE